MMISSSTDTHGLHESPADVLGDLETIHIDDLSLDLSEFGIEGIGATFAASDTPSRDGATAVVAREGADASNLQDGRQLLTGGDPAPAVLAGVVGAEPQQVLQYQEQQPIPLWEAYGRSAAADVAVPEGLRVQTATSPEADVILMDWFREVASLNCLKDGKAFWERQANGRSGQLSHHGPDAPGWAGPQARVLPTDLLQKLWPIDGAVNAGSGVNDAAAEHAGYGSSSSGAYSRFSVLNFMGPTQPRIFVKTIGMSGNSGSKSRFARLLHQGCSAAGSDSSSRLAAKEPSESRDLYIIDKYIYRADYKGLAVYKIMLAEYLGPVDRAAFEESMKRNKSLKGGKQDNHDEWETGDFEVKGSKGMYIKLRWRSWWPGLYTVNAPKATMSMLPERRRCSRSVPRCSTAPNPRGLSCPSEMQCGQVIGCPQQQQQWQWQGQASFTAGPLPQLQPQDAESLTVAPLGGPYAPSLSNTGTPLAGAGFSRVMALEAQLGILASPYSSCLSSGQHMLSPHEPHGLSHDLVSPGPPGAAPPHAHGGALLSAGGFIQQPVCGSLPQLLIPSPPPTPAQQLSQQPWLQPSQAQQFPSGCWMTGGHEHATPPQAWTATLQPQQLLHTPRPQLQLTPAAGAPQLPEYSPQQFQQEGGAAWTDVPVHAAILPDGFGGLGPQQQQQQFVGPPHPNLYLQQELLLPLQGDNQTQRCSSQERQLQPHSAVVLQGATPLMLHQHSPWMGDARSRELQQQLPVSTDLLLTQVSSTLCGSLLCVDEETSPAAVLGADAAHGLDPWQPAAVDGVVESREGLQLAAAPCDGTQAGHEVGPHRAKPAAAKVAQAGLVGQSPVALPPQVVMVAACDDYPGEQAQGSTPATAAVLTGAPRGIVAGPVVTLVDDEEEEDGGTEVQRQEQKQRAEARVQVVEEFLPVYLKSRLCDMHAVHVMLRGYVEDLGTARDLLAVRDHNTKGYGLLNMLMHAAIRLGAGCGDTGGSANTIHTSGSSGSSHGGDRGGDDRGRKLEAFVVEMIEIVLERLDEAATAAGLPREGIRMYRRMLLTQADQESHDTPNHTCARFNLLVVQQWLLERCDASTLLVATKDGWLPLATACRARHRAAAVAYLRRARDLGLFEAGKLPASTRVSPREVVLADLTRFNKYYRDSRAREILEEAIREVWPDGGDGAPAVFDGVANAEALKHDAEELQRVLQNLDLTASSNSGSSNNNEGNTKAPRSRGREEAAGSRRSLSSRTGGGSL